MKNRALVSFDDICFYQCKHCYTLDTCRNNRNRTIDEIVDSIETKVFDVVYVSQRRDNFINPDEGIELCEKIFNKYGCNIFVITRNILKKEQIYRIIELRDKMNKKGKEIIFACSIFATKSYMKSENPRRIPSPDERINFIKKISNLGIKTMVIIRPVFPEAMIPLEELYEIVDKCAQFKTYIVSSGLAVNDDICWRLGINPNDLCYLEDSDYLEGVMEGNLRFVNVQQELLKLRCYCEQKNIMFFEHTMQALNHITSDL